MPEQHETSIRRPATKIIATLGPASWTPSAIRDLALAGTSAFRLNFSHGDVEILRGVVNCIRQVSQELGTPIAILGDLAGPKLRVGVVPGGGTITLEDGQEVLLDPSSREVVRGRLGVSHYSVVKDVPDGSRILLDDGNFELKSLKRDGDCLRAVVVHGGELSSRKGINIPGVMLSIPAITEKDEADLAFGMQVGVDFFAMSFVRTARDVVDLKRRIALHGRHTPVVAKIETPIAVENLSSILDVSDGIMVARGDLGVEIGPERLPVVQKEIIRAARSRGKLVITATQMLDSMTHNPHPTRAEATDVANALFDGTDAVMLSQETAVGLYPVITVNTMREIAWNAEQSDLFVAQARLFQRPQDHGIAHAAIKAACVAAEEVEAKAILAFSSTGWTAYGVAAWRPHCPVFALTDDPSAFNRFALCRGARAFLIPSARDIAHLYALGLAATVKAGALVKDDVVVLLSGARSHGAGANTIRIYKVGARDDRNAGSNAGGDAL
ncbi:MAG: pyruvate kinase [Planctomycetes bacterium]|nr:pyruvate kinase [Planctomycetota bacterium]